MKRSSRTTREISYEEVHDELEGESHTADFTDPGSAIAGLAELAALDTEAAQWTLTVLRGPTIGLIVPLGEVSVVGRGAGSDVQLDDGKLSRRHAVFEREGDDLYVTDLASRNGTFIEGERTQGRKKLRDGVHVQLGQTLLRAQLRDRLEVEAAAALYESSLRDPLTKLYNRRHLDDQLAAEVAYALRHRTDLSAMVLDLDHFKRVNDQLGHQAGDHVLVAFAKYLTSTLRREDLVARYGGEEFVIVCRGIGPRGAEILAQRIRADVEALEILWEEKPIPITTSIGVATCTPRTPYPTAEELLAAADRCLYRAKRAGRNLVICDASPRG